MTKFGLCLAFASIANMLLPWSGSLASGAGIRTGQKAESSLAVRDVALGLGGVLSGKLAGVSSNGAQGQLIAADGRVIRFRTNENGGFRVEGVNGGSYKLVLAEQVTSLRLWKQGTAPPIAQPALILSNPSSVQRGQSPLHCLLPSGETLLIGALIAAAIVIPIAVHNSGDDADGS